MPLHLAIPRVLRRPPRPAAPPTDGGAGEAPTRGWYLSSFELQRGLDVIELHGAVLPGPEAWPDPTERLPQA